MKNLIIVICIALFATQSNHAQEWMTDFDTAKKTAVQENKPILLVFKGSDWCAPCIKLDKELFQSSEFKEHATTNYILLEADFPKRKKNALTEAQQNHNNALAETYNKRGIFPFVVLLDGDGKKLGETGYLNKSPKEYIALFTSLIK